VLYGRGHCVGLITGPDTSYLVWYVCVILKPQQTRATDLPAVVAPWGMGISG